jgi:hypothetical protein
MRNYFAVALVYILISITIISYWAIKINPKNAEIQKPVAVEMMPQH